MGGGVYRYVTEALWPSWTFLPGKKVKCKIKIVNEFKIKCRVCMLQLSHY